MFSSLIRSASFTAFFLGYRCVLYARWEKAEGRTGLHGGKRVGNRQGEEARIYKIARKGLDALLRARQLSTVRITLAPVAIKEK